jgi:DNA-binding CsgD family transcriptional regulator
METLLSPAEIKVLHLMAKEHNIKSIAAVLNLSHKTIANHRERMLRKTGCANAVGLVIWGIKNNIISIND